jgi:hypothetical protein
MFNFAIVDRSSVLFAADRLVMGVLIVLPPLTEPVGVDVDVEASVPLLIAADFFAAFSARRFCLDAEGAMRSTKQNRCHRGVACCLRSHRGNLSQPNLSMKSTTTDEAKPLLLSKHLFTTAPDFLSKVPSLHLLLLTLTGWLTVVYTLIQVLLIVYVLDYVTSIGASRPTYTLKVHTDISKRKGGARKVIVTTLGYVSR